MTATAPIAAAAVPDFWFGAAPLATPAVVPADLPVGASVWLLRLGVAATTARAVPVLPDMPAVMPVAGFGWPPVVDVAAPRLLASDRGWIGEPDDSGAPNVAYRALLAAPPVIESAIPLVPGEYRRRVVSAGELALLNPRGALDGLAGDWSVGGQLVDVLCGPHRRPRHAPLGSFVTVARLRAAGAASGTNRLALPLQDAVADLSVPACATYAGTGGAEGTVEMAGQPKPLLLGLRRNIPVVLEDPARLIYRISHGNPISAVLAVRERGVPITAGSLRLTRALLDANVPSAGTYDWCLADSTIRIEPAGGTTLTAVTVDARGDAAGGYSGGTPASIALKLLLGPGGLGLPAIASDAFTTWPVGEAGLWLRGGTVAEAMDRLAERLATCWWGPDRLGRITGADIAPPEDLAPQWDITPPMLRAPPEEVPGGPAPRWRSRVGYAVWESVQTGQELAGSVSDADRQAYAQEARLAEAADPAIQAAYRLAEDADPVNSVFDLESDAQAVALRLQALFGKPRRTWRVSLNRSGIALEAGAAVRLTYPRHGLAAGRVLIVRRVSIRGDQTEALLWG